MRLQDGGFFNFIKKTLSSLVRFNTLVGGNMTLTGTYGFYINPSYISEYEKVTNTGIRKVIDFLKSTGTKISGVILKDYCEHNKPDLCPYGYAEFSVQPNMIMEIKSGWANFDDYISAMKSKYRTRVRRARKKASSLTKKTLSLDDIKENNKTISKLYKYVADGASFNLFTLPEDYFWSLQNQLGDAMKLTAYYDQEEMVGFCTSIKNLDYMDAHFLGYHPDYNQNHQIYLNMLYDLVEESIDGGVKKLVLSRTAMEIKSSVGAEAKEMFVFMKSTNKLMNKLLPKALDYFVPDTKWKPRSPFS